LWKDILAARKRDLDAVDILISFGKDSGVAYDDLPARDNTPSILRSASIGSPKIRFLFRLLAEVVVMCKEKLLIFVSYPEQQYFLELVCYDRLLFEALYGLLTFLNYR